METRTHDMNDMWKVDQITGKTSLLFFIISSVGSFIRFDQWKKDEGDKANGLTLTPNDTII